MTIDARERRALAAANATRERRWPRRLAAVAGVLVVLLAVGVAGVGWYYANVLLTPVHSWEYDQTVRASSAATVTLARTPSTDEPGTYGVQWPAGRAVLGPATGGDASTVVRPVVAGPAPASGTKVAWTAELAAHDPREAAGLDFTEVSVSSPVGAMPAWLVPADGPKASTWVVEVHGRGGTREEGLRVLPVLHRDGYTVLDVTYRNDQGAAASPDGLYHLGQTEWRDVDAALGFAQQHGARRVVVYGWSMGGAVVEQLLAHTTHRDLIVASVLDAPVVDWRSTLDLQAANRGLPGFLTPVAEQISSWRADIDWDALDARRRPVTLPTLLVHGDRDRTVPVGPSRQLAAANPSTVTYLEVHGADHTAAWNVDPARYEAALTSFLQAHAG